MQLTVSVTCYKSKKCKEYQGLQSQKAQNTCPYQTSKDQELVSGVAKPETTKLVPYQLHSLHSHFAFFIMHQHFPDGFTAELAKLSILANHQRHDSLQQISRIIEVV